MITKSELMTKRQSAGFALAACENQLSSYDAALAQARQKAAHDNEVFKRMGRLELAQLTSDASYIKLAAELPKLRAEVMRLDAQIKRLNEEATAAEKAEQQRRAKIQEKHGIAQLRVAYEIAGLRLALAQLDIQIESEGFRPGSHEFLLLDGQRQRISARLAELS